MGESPLKLLGLGAATVVVAVVLVSLWASTAQFSWSSDAWTEWIPGIVFGMVFIPLIALVLIWLWKMIS
jgi:hypothetical protein